MHFDAIYWLFFFFCPAYLENFFIFSGLRDVFFLDDKKKLSS